MAYGNCPNCGSVNTQAGLGSNAQCLDCGTLFGPEGEVAAGPDQETIDVITSTLVPTGPHVVGNLADLQRAGAAAAAGASNAMREGVELPGGTTQKAVKEANAAEAERVAAIGETGTGGGDEVTTSKS